MQTNAAVLNKITPQYQVREQAGHRTGVIDRVADRLERKDGMMEYWAGYGLCGLTVLYLLGNLVRMLF